jgi:hypothetical protein
MSEYYEMKEKYESEDKQYDKNWKTIIRN